MSSLRTNDTIIALSSGSPPSGVAVVRVSGPKSHYLVEQFCGDAPKARFLALRRLRLADGSSLDDGMVVVFNGPHSFTGEDCAEFQVHGSVAVVKALLRQATAYEGVRLAEAGEFTRRAFENGRLDLTAAEGLSDLISAETEMQRTQALARAGGGIATKISVWRNALLDLRAEIEAQLDFSDEDDVPVGLGEDWLARVGALFEELGAEAENTRQGRIVREGFRVALAGKPNAGKSSLLNALAKSDIAIVTDEAGTTRDVREVGLDVNGRLIILVDMAGLRDTDSVAEGEGVRRAREQIEIADLVLWLSPNEDDWKDAIGTGSVLIKSKCDLGRSAQADLNISVQTGEGIPQLLDMISERADLSTGSEIPLVSRERDRVALKRAAGELEKLQRRELPLELAAEQLRLASDELGRLTGRLDPELVLDHLFANFCIGK